MLRDEAEAVALDLVDQRVVGLAKAGRGAGDRVEHGLDAFSHDPPSGLRFASRRCPLHLEVNGFMQDTPSRQVTASQAAAADDSARSSDLACRVTGHVCLQGCLVSTQKRDGFTSNGLPPDIKQAPSRWAFFKPQQSTYKLDFESPSGSIRHSADESVVREIGQPPKPRLSCAIDVWHA